MTGLVRPKRMPICPVLLQGSVEPFGLAVLPRAVRPGLHMPCTKQSQRVLEGVGGDVVLRALSHHAPNRDAVLGEDPCGQERSAAGALFIRQDLSEGEPGSFTHGDMNVVEAEPTGAVSMARRD